MALDHKILQRALNASVKWEHMISLCILCNVSVAIPGPFYAPQQYGVPVFSHLQDLKAYTY